MVGETVARPAADSELLPIGMLLCSGGHLPAGVVRFRWGVFVSTIDETGMA